MEATTTVLVVDDDQALLRFISLTLRTEALDVETVARADEGLRRLESTHPRLIILDLSMPEMDGRTFYREARSIGYSGPIVICSAFGAEAAQRELGAEAALPKPFEPDALITLVRSFVDPNN
jgi:DNA-binding response OmpR family regulator